MELLTQLQSTNADYTRTYHGPDDNAPLKLLELDHDADSDNVGGYKADPVEIPLYDDAEDATCPKNFYFAALDRRWRGRADEFPAYGKTLFVRYAAVTEQQWRETAAVDHVDQRYRITQVIAPQGMRSDWRILLEPIERP